MIEIYDEGKLYCSVQKSQLNDWNQGKTLLFRFTLNWQLYTRNYLTIPAHIHTRTPAKGREKKPLRLSAAKKQMMI